MNAPAACQKVCETVECDEKAARWTGVTCNDWKIWDSQVAEWSKQSLPSSPMFSDRSRSAS